MKPYNEYLAMTAEQIMADPEAPESLRIAARIELEKAQKFDLEAEVARNRKAGLSIGFRKGWLRWQSWLNIIIQTVRSTLTTTATVTLRRMKCSGALSGCRKRRGNY